MSETLLQVKDLHAYYDNSHVLQGVEFDVPKGSVVSLLGRNGAGKTTTLRSIMRLIPYRQGVITFRGRDLAGMAPYAVARGGLALVHETRNIFPSLTVKENLLVAARRSVTRKNEWTIDRVYEVFPRLKERERNGGSQLSGGEQQMLAIARALLTNPDLLLLDEPSEGLAPKIVQDIRGILQQLKQQGTTMLLVEQSLSLALALSDENLVLGRGKIRWRGTSQQLRSETAVMSTWLGV
jgi:branched-chain amino acid transport system ATP-binding protein